MAEWVLEHLWAHSINIHIDNSQIPGLTNSFFQFIWETVKYKFINLVNFRLGMIFLVLAWIRLDEVNLNRQELYIENDAYLRKA